MASEYETDELSIEELRKEFNIPKTEINKKIAMIIHQLNKLPISIAHLMICETIEYLVSELPEDLYKHFLISLAINLNTIAHRISENKNKN